MASALGLRAFKSSRTALVVPKLTRSFSASLSRSEHYPDADFATFKKVTSGSDAEERLVLVDFYANWCQPCHMLSPILKRISDDPTAKSGTGLPVDVITIDTESADGMELSQRFKIRALPTVIAFRKGQNVMHFVGALPEPEVRSFLQKV
ncbi:thioredoxin-like protein [Rhodocollybia butyracea]|uniref:Thioredoxin-like protein n=1 Tax=Rhodocollybia butyracea TaxID=206335 RepID=A0A9P5UG64_9AGAR|nr:thioredoxin-like protein [Rhodocollybia butyracea]